MEHKPKPVIGVRLLGRRGCETAKERRDSHRNAKRNPPFANFLSTSTAVVVIVVLIAVMAVAPVPVLPLFVLIPTLVIHVSAMRIDFPLLVIHDFLVIPMVVIVAIVVVYARGAAGY